MSVYAPGARIVVRDAEWLVRQVERTDTAGDALKVVGISELVRNREAIFLTQAEKAIQVLDPAKTALVSDTSPGFQSSLLYLESMLRQTPPTDDRLYVGHRAAMDPVPYQLDPTIQALKQPRQRILMADAVGLGKTLECGILLSELIRRGRGRRILVVTVKSMLTQFQKELWSRFTIPLTRLDSIGLARVRSHIPSNHNPFHYFDKSIVSVDTLKQDSEYRVHLENAWWDVIVIDEAHNVAERGTGQGLSLRSRLAKLLASRSDSLILLSATPHDGRAKSFASLMNMLDPTAIADPENYGPDDIRGLFIRRFKKDIQDQVASAFKERTIRKVRTKASPEEEQAFDILTGLRFTTLDRQAGAGQLFRTTLEKALFSSPAACRETIANRIQRLSKKGADETSEDITSLKTLDAALADVSPERFSKFKQLVQMLQSQGEFHFTGKDKNDRLVIFTERIETLRFLHEHLPTLLKLKDGQTTMLHGGMPDTEQQQVVEDFGRDESPLRLLLASDVASEGINLHYLCHRMIHFDIPWSLMVFQQRNGRIDRYGQEREPRIAYLMTESDNGTIKGDTRILELLIDKDQEAVRSIGDPSAFMGVYDETEEERLTAKAMEDNLSPEAFEKRLENNLPEANDPLSILLGLAEAPLPAPIESPTATMPTLFSDDYNYFLAGLRTLRQDRDLDLHFEEQPEERIVEFTPPKDLQMRLRALPREIRSELMLFTDDKRRIQQEIARARTEETAWPRLHYLWQQHPVLSWLEDKLLARFGRHEAPVLHLGSVMKPKESIFMLSGLIPNRKGHPLIQHWFGVHIQDAAYQGILDLPEILTRAGLGSRPLPNTGQAPNIAPLSALLPVVINKAKATMSDRRKAFQDRITPQLNDQLKRLSELRERHRHQIQRHFEGLNLPEHRIQDKREAKYREVQTLFGEYETWIQDTMTTEDNPYIKVCAVLVG